MPEDVSALARFEGRWETSPYGVDWQLDFRLTYRRGAGGGQG